MIRPAFVCAREAPMLWFDFHALGLAGNLAVFAVASVVVWVAGDRLARYSQIIAERTRMGQAFVSTSFLALAGSLPEMSLASAAAALGDVELAANSLLGGIAITMVVVAITDLAVGKEPLSIDVQHPVVLLQGSLVIVMLTVAAAGITTGDRLLPGIGVAGMWTTALLMLYVLGLLLVRRLQRFHPWTPDAAPEPQDGGQIAEAHPADASDRHDPGVGLVIRLAALATAAVLAAGTVLAFSAHALAEQTGLGAGLVGLLFGGVATSLPELSATISSVRLKQYEVAFYDAFGTNMCSVVLLLLVDLLYVGGPVLGELGRFSTFAVLLGTALTAIYLAGLVARPRRPLWRMGIDSVTVLVVSAVGFAILCFLK
jgi:cation:H+ antiporter